MLNKLLIHFKLLGKQVNRIMVHLFHKFDIFCSVLGFKIAQPASCNHRHVPSLSHLCCLLQWHGITESVK